MAKGKKKSSTSKKALRKLPDYGVQLAEHRAEQEKQQVAAGASTDDKLFFEDTQGELASRAHRSRAARKHQARTQTLAVDAVLQPNPLAEKAPAPPSKTSHSGSNRKHKPANRFRSKTASSQQLKRQKEEYTHAQCYDVWAVDDEQIKRNRKWRPVPLSGTDSEALPHDGDAESYNPETVAHSNATAREAAAALRTQQREEIRRVNRPVLMPTGQMERLLEEELLTAGPDDAEEESAQSERQKTEGTQSIHNPEYGLNMAHVVPEDKQRDNADAEKASDDTTAADAEDEVRISVGPRPVERRKTKQELRKQKRKREMEEKEEQRKALKKQRREIDAIDRIKQDIEQSEQRLKALRRRRELARARRRKQQPSKLGPVQYKAEPAHILPPSEAGGSLRELRGAASLLRERYRDMQRRELIEPRTRVTRRKRASYVVEVGNRKERERELQEEIQTQLQTYKHT